jgi:hypothetical protein
MPVPVNKTLLALSLALKDLEATLSENEQEAFRNTAERLAIDPDNWEDYEPDLLAVIQANPSLNQLYQTARSQLDVLSDKIPSNLLPTQAELEKAIPTVQTPETRGFAPLSDDYESSEINNMVINILATSNPPETAKKLTRLEQLKQFLQQNISKK